MSPPAQAAPAGGGPSSASVQAEADRTGERSSGGEDSRPPGGRSVASALPVSSAVSRAGGASTPPPFEFCEMMFDEPAVKRLVDDSPARFGLAGRGPLESVTAVSPRGNRGSGVSGGQVATANVSQHSLSADSGSISGKADPRSSAVAPESPVPVTLQNPDVRPAAPAVSRFLPLRASLREEDALPRIQSLPVILDSGESAVAGMARKLGVPGAQTSLGAKNPISPVATERQKRLFDYYQTPARVPWMRDPPSLSPADPWLRRLDEELRDYVCFTELGPEECRARAELVASIERVVTALYPGAYVASYGSFSTGLSGYWADVDIEVFFPPQASAVRAGQYPRKSAELSTPSSVPKLFQKMNAIGAALRQELSPKHLEIRDTARVPIISGTDDKTGLEFDIGFGSPSGLANAEEVAQYCAHRPEAKMLILVTKAFLRQRALHQPFTGGMSGHMVFQLVRTYLDERPVIFPYERIEEAAFAQSLLEFFEFYGTMFNFRSLGFCADGNAQQTYFFVKEASKLFRRAVKARGKAAVFSMIDPLCNKNDIGLGAFNWPTIQRRFSDAYFTLLRSGGLCEAPGSRYRHAATWVTCSDREGDEACGEGGEAGEGPHPRAICSILGAIVMPDAQGLLVREKCINLYSKGTAGGGGEEKRAEADA